MNVFRKLTANIKGKKFAILFLVISICLLASFLFFASKMNDYSVNRINFMTKLSNRPVTAGDVKFANIDLNIVEVRDIDVREGSYVVSSYLDVSYNSKEIPEVPEFVVKNAQILEKTLLNRVVAPDGQRNDSYYLLTKHNFTPMVYEFPLDRQVLVMDIMSKNPFGAYSFRINNVRVTRGISFDSYNYVNSGKTMKVDTFQSPKGGKFTSYLTRAYIVIERQSFLVYLRSFQMMLVSVILALVSFLSVSDNARYGAILGAILVSMGNLNVLFGKIHDGVRLTFLDISCLYYVLIIVGVLIMVSINSRYRDTLEKIEHKLEVQTDLSDDDRMDLTLKKTQMMRRIKIIDKYAVISLNIMFWGFFFGAYLILI